MEWRSGSTGAGAFLGCGAGIGIIQPVSLHGIPLLGQLASSLSTALSQFDAATGGLGRRASRAAAGLGPRFGVKQLGAGGGCGVMLGYGWGFGVFLRPPALQQAQVALADVAAALAERLPPPARELLSKHRAAQHQHQQHQREGGAWLEHQSQGEGTAGLRLEGGMLSSDACPPTNSGAAALPAAAQQPDPAWLEQQWQQQKELEALNKLIISQQNQLTELQRQVIALQEAVHNTKR